MLGALRLVADHYATMSAERETRYFGAIGLTFDDAVGRNRLELSNQTVLMLVASAEAALHRDFRRRLASPTRSATRTAAVALVDATDSPSLQQLVVFWAGQAQITGNRLWNMRRLIQLRNWLAHGRRWADKSGLQPNPVRAHEIIQDFLAGIPEFRN